MRNVILLFVILLLNSLSHALNAGRQEKEIYSTYIREIVQPYWKSSGWDTTEKIVVEDAIGGSENSMHVFSLWNNDSLYFFFKVYDTCLRAYQSIKDHQNLYLDDMVEVLIDTQNSKDSCWSENDIIYHVNLLGVKKDDRGTSKCITDPNWDGNARISVYLFGTLNDTTDIDSGYIITLAIPWSEIDQIPKPGLTMGINFANGDNDGRGRQLFDWVGAWPFRSPYAFGNLILKEK